MRHLHITHRSVALAAAAILCTLSIRPSESHAQACSAPSTVAGTCSPSGASYGSVDFDQTCLKYGGVADDSGQINSSPASTGSRFNVLALVQSSICPALYGQPISTIAIFDPDNGAQIPIAAKPATDALMDPSSAQNAYAWVSFRLDDSATDDTVWKTWPYLTLQNRSDLPTVSALIREHGAITIRFNRLNTIAIPMVDTPAPTNLTAALGLDGKAALNWKTSSG
ncbi:MAG: hypothetical protein KGI66_05270, partial [Patescibacteria group bacterium]|nr:hypothetical protein [Patescibacteria group bacterium]